MLLNHSNGIGNLPTPLHQGRCRKISGTGPVNLPAPVAWSSWFRQFAGTIIDHPADHFRRERANLPGAQAEHK